jgi:hypothetical protein
MWMMVLLHIIGMYRVVETKAIEVMEVSDS